MKTPRKIKKKATQISGKVVAKSLADIAQQITASVMKEKAEKETSPKTKQKLQLLQPLSNPTLSIRRGKDRALTHSGMLQQARAINHPGRRKPKIVSGFQLQLDYALNTSGRGVVIEKLLPFAVNEIENKIFRLIHSTKPDLFAEFDDPLKALLQLRVLYIPMVCRGLLNYEIKKNTAEILWLGALSVYSVAFERTLLERFYRAKLQAKLFTTDSKQIQKWATAELGGTVFTWFDKAHDGYKFWLSRFDKWFEYAMRSLDHYIGCQSIHYREETGSLKQAAHLGILKCLDALPEELFKDFLKLEIVPGADAQMFKKNAGKRKTNPRNLEFEQWLIESWPLVLEYGWNYPDIRRAASLRFKLSHENLYHEIPDLKDHCQKLGLKLGRGSNKVGRPVESVVCVNPVLHEVALMIEGLEDSEWFLGRTQAGFKNFNSISRQG